MAEKQPDIQKDSLESILIESIHTLVYEKDINTALNCFLETICKYYQAERGYVFEMDGTKQIADNTFEWCAEGIEAEIGRLQGISVDKLDEKVPGKRRVLYCGPGGRRALRQGGL